MANGKWTPGFGSPAAGPQETLPCPVHRCRRGEIAGRGSSSHAPKKRGSASPVRTADQFWRNPAERLPRIRPRQWGSSRAPREASATFLKCPVTLSNGAADNPARPLPTRLRVFDDPAHQEVRRAKNTRKDRRDSHPEIKAPPRESGAAPRPWFGLASSQGIKRSRAGLRAQVADFHSGVYEVC